MLHLWIKAMRGSSSTSVSYNLWLSLFMFFSFVIYNKNKSIKSWCTMNKRLVVNMASMRHVQNDHEQLKHKKRHFSLFRVQSVMVATIVAHKKYDTRS